MEDAISGLKAGKAAGAKTLAVCTSTPRSVLLESDAKPDYIVDDLTRWGYMSASASDQGLIDI